MPVFTVSETASPGPGFSTKAHAAIRRGDDQSVFQRIGNAREHHRRQRLVFAVESEGGGEVEIGHAVAGEHAERFVEKVRRLPHARPAVPRGVRSV